MASFMYCLPYSYRSSNYCDNYCYSNSWKSDNFKKRAIKKEAKNWYQKGLRVITLQGAIEKSSILLSQYWKNEWLDWTIIISYFGGSNNIFADCTFLQLKFLSSVLLCKKYVLSAPGFTNLLKLVYFQILTYLF